MASAFERDVLALIKAARAIQTEAHRDSIRLIVFVDECDHLYPHLADAGYWKSDFFILWNTLQTIKRGLESPDELVYVLSGVNPSGVEQGSLQEQPNPLFETQRIYLAPMSESDACTLLRGLGNRMGLIFDDGSVAETYRLVGGHPTLLRRFGSAIHDANRNRPSLMTITTSEIQRVFAKHKRDLFNQVAWILEHLARVSPDEERLLRDVATGGAQAYSDLWGVNEFRETYAHHLERYGLLRFTDDLPEVTMFLIREALQKPVASEFKEQKRELKELIESIEQSVRGRIRTDLEKDRTTADTLAAVINSIPSDPRNRPMGRQDLLDLGEVAGVGAVLEGLNWGDYEILLNKYYVEIEWVGVAVEKADRLALLKAAFTKAHLVRHNNDHALKKMIGDQGFAGLFAELSAVRDMFAA